MSLQVRVVDTVAATESVVESMSLQVMVVDTVAATESVVDLIQPIGVCGPLTETG